MLDRYARLALASACVFVVQAEDGIRDLVRSRGLGDVYKRQGQETTGPGGFGKALRTIRVVRDIADQVRVHAPEAVSYTHLTLPTSDLV